MTEFSIICDMSYENLHKILTEKRKDISLSTLIKLCENSGIEICDVLDLNLKPKNCEIRIKLNEGKCDMFYKFV